MRLNRPFVEPDRLAEWQASGRAFHVVDARAERAYAQGHIAGAVPLDARALNPVVGGVRRPIGADELAARLAALGIGADPTVVVGSHGGSDAAHVWWTLRSAGHPDARLLDGGIEGWAAGGGALVTETPEFAPAELLPLDRDPAASISMAELQRRLGEGGLAVLDTRSPGEYSGADQLAARGGHIPGAGLVPWDSLLAGNPPRLRPPDDLRAALAWALDAPEAVTYCQSGVRAAHTYAVLEYLGHPRPRLYIGSWAEWGNDPAVPIESGEGKEPS